MLSIHLRRNLNMNLVKGNVKDLQLVLQSSLFVLVLLSEDVGYLYKDSVVGDNLNQQLRTMIVSNALKRNQSCLP